MLIITANNQEYQCPEVLADITFEKYAKYIDLCGTMPEPLKELSKIEHELLDTEGMTEDEIDKKLSRIETLHNRLNVGLGKKQYTEFKIRIVSHFIGMDEETMKGKNGINIESLNTLFNIIHYALHIVNEGEEFIESVKLSGIEYEIANGSNMTVGEFLEAAQIEEFNIKLGKGYHETMIDLCAILLRKKGEEFSDEVFKRNRKDFAQLDMETVSRIAFFFHKKNEELLKIVTLSFLQAQVEELKAARQNALDGTLYLQA